MNEKKVEVGIFDSTQTPPGQEGCVDCAHRIGNGLIISHGAISAVNTLLTAIQLIVQHTNNFDTETRVGLLRNASKAFALCADNEEAGRAMPKPTHPEGGRA